MKNNNKMHYKHIKQFAGFTLIEVMIVVVIIGVLASISLPTYSEYVRKANRSYAKITLMELAQSQERYYAANMSYAKSLDDLSASIKKVGSQYKTKGGEYIIALSARASGGGNCTPGGNTPCLEFTATAAIDNTGPQKKDTTCKKFTVDQVGNRLAYDSGDNSMDSCWGRD